jgi:ubiquitin-activating enzyme E1
MNKVDTNLYSRQIKTLGIETMRKLQNLKILIIGMRGLGVEITKNIILSGVKEVKILDQNITSINDLGNNFFLSEENI